MPCPLRPGSHADYQGRACFKRWAEIFNNDAGVTSAILDRMLHGAETVVIEGKSFRMKDQIDPPNAS